MGKRAPVGTGKHQGRLPITGPLIYHPMEELLHGYCGSSLHVPLVIAVSNTDSKLCQSADDCDEDLRISRRRGSVHDAATVAKHGVACQLRLLIQALYGRQIRGFQSLGCTIWVDA